MAVCEGSGEARMDPGNSPEEGRDRRRKQSHGNETEKPGDGTAVGGAKILQALQKSTGQYLLSGYLMTLVKKKIKVELHILHWFIFTFYFLRFLLIVFITTY